MTDRLRCAMCDSPRALRWIVVSVLDEEPVTGLICSIDCLDGYTYRVISTLLEAVSDE